MFRRLKRMLTDYRDGVNRTARSTSGLDKEYYQNLHNRNKSYNSNNWLVSYFQETGLLNNIPNNFKVGEIGCGNGQFCEILTHQVDKIYAFDWAMSNAFKPERFANIKFIKGDILNIDLDQFNLDLILSGDVLEHFDEENLKLLIPKMISAAQYNLHIIACYDDGHSHLTIKDPEWWLAKFQEFDPNYSLTETRRENVAVISNWKT